MYLELRGIRKTFDGAVALEGIDLSVGEHEFVCLLGPSGCGKTTLLRIVAGLLPFDSGAITLGGRDLSALPARKRALRHRVPVVFAVSQHDRGRERRLRPAHPRREPRAHRGAGA